MEQVTAPAALADFVAGLIDIKPSEKQDLLETFDVQMRLERAIASVLEP